MVGFPGMAVFPGIGAGIGAACLITVTPSGVFFWSSAIGVFTPVAEVEDGGSPQKNLMSRVTKSLRNCHSVV